MKHYPTCPSHSDNYDVPTSEVKAKHTPTPWTEMNSHKAGFRNIVSWGDDEPQNRKFICEIAPSDTSVEDCSLIVKSVNHHDELVTALEQCEEAMGALLSAAVMAPQIVRNHPPFERGENLTDSALTNARSLLTKLKG